MITEIKNILQKLDGVNSFCEEYLLKIILQEIVDINEDKIDLEKSKISIEDGLCLDLISKFGKSCNIYFELREKNIVDIQIGYGGEYIYHHQHNNYNDGYKLKEAIKDILNQAIEEETVFIKDKLIKATYKVKHIIENKEIYQFYTIILGSAFSFSKKIINIRRFEKWK